MDKKGYIYIQQHISGLYYIGKREDGRKDYVGGGSSFLKHYKEAPHDWERTILIDGLTSEQCRAYEAFFVNPTVLQDPLCLNMITGGKVNPMKGRHHTLETKEKISKKLKGENHPFYGKTRPEHSKQMSGPNSPTYGKPSAFSQLPEDKQEEFRLKMSKVTSGENNGFFGKTHSTSSKQKMRGKRSPSEAYCKPKAKYTCSVCGKTVGGKPNLLRWHEDNCSAKRRYYVRD